MPHASRPNITTSDWRRVIVIRYLAASCRLGRETYYDFPREYFCVAGTDAYGCRRDAFDPGSGSSTGGYTGDPAVVPLGQHEAGGQPPPVELDVREGRANLLPAAGIAAKL
eukprot:SAG11_NODE_9690_length_889_cov_1.858228_1_plen_111_part_00